MANKKPPERVGTLNVRRIPVHLFRIIRSKAALDGKTISEYVIGVLDRVHSPAAEKR